MKSCTTQICIKLDALQNVNSSPHVHLQPTTKSLIVGHSDANKACWLLKKKKPIGYSCFQRKYIGTGKKSELHCIFKPCRMLFPIDIHPVHVYVLCLFIFYKLREIEMVFLELNPNYSFFKLIVVYHSSFLPYIM